MIRKNNKFFSFFRISPPMAANKSVRYPVAKCRDTGQNAWAYSTSRDAGPFDCIECGAEMSLKQGQVLAAHFSHKHIGPRDGTQNSTACQRGESAIHKEAKLWITDHLPECIFLAGCKRCTKELVRATYQDHTAKCELFDSNLRLQPDVTIFS